MRITNIDQRAYDIEALFVAMASSEDCLQAAKGRMFLELVRYLNSQGTAPQACGFLIGGEFWLKPANPANRNSVKIWVDWRDYAPLRDGLPEMHYRLQGARPGSRVSQDARAESPEEVAQAIWEAFGWTRKRE